jgi:hypothetical protein
VANTCIESAGRFAMELGYHVTLVTDATAAFSPEMMHAAHKLERADLCARVPDNCGTDLSIAGWSGRSRLGSVCGSALLRQHPVFGFEILARMRHELGGARVIDAFHADDLLRQLRIVLADMFDQRGLGVGRAGDKDRTGIGDRLRDRMQKSMVFGGVPAADRIGLVMNVFGGIVGVQHQLLDIGRAEMKNARFAMIDPNDGVMMMDGHIGSFAQC